MLSLAVPKRCWSWPRCKWSNGSSARIGLTAPNNRPWRTAIRPLTAAATSGQLNVGAPMSSAQPLHPLHPLQPLHPHGLSGEWASTAMAAYGSGQVMCSSMTIGGHFRSLSLPLQPITSAHHSRFQIVVAGAPKTPLVSTPIRRWSASTVATDDTIVHDRPPPTESTQTTDRSKSHTFVVAIDGSDEAHWAWETAVTLCRPNDRLVMLTVPVPVSPFSVHSPLGEDGIGSKYHRDLVQKDAEQWSGVKDSYEHLSQERGIKNYSYMVLPASNVPGDDLLTHAEAQGANYIIVGSRGMSAVKRLMLGSVAYFMLQYAKCNVILAKRQPHQRPISLNPVPRPVPITATAKMKQRVAATIAPVERE